MGGPPERRPNAVVLAAVDPIGNCHCGALLEVLSLKLVALLEIPPLDVALGFVELAAVAGFDLLLPQQVSQPGRDRLGDDLGAFGLKEPEHIEVPVALGGLRPELARDLDDGLGLQAVELDLVHASRNFAQRLGVVLAGELIDELREQVERVERAAVACLEERAQLALDLRGFLLLDRFAQEVERLGQRLVGFARRGLVGPELVGELVEQVAHVDRVDQAHEEVGIEIESRLDLGLLEPALLLEQQDAEAVEPGVAEG